MLISSCQLLQTIGTPGATSSLFPDGYNRLIHGDCLEVMRGLPGESFDVIYIDPPFFTGVERRLQQSQQRGPSYSDTWDEGSQEYLDWLEVRLAEMRRLLQPQGALFVHLDWHAVHYVKVMLDRLFGMSCFQNEFIWYYSGGGASKTRFARKHDTILYYTRSATEWKFYADRMRTPHKWTRGQKRADGSERDYEKGKLADDVWQHHALLPWASESLGYPTQKPEALLERLLLAVSDEGDVIGDFFCGSGTTAAVAQQLGRRWLTTDASRPAICLTAERLAEQLAPGCIKYTAQRSRARATERYEQIVADTERVGLDAETLAACGLAITTGTGCVIERLVDNAPGGIM